MQKRSDVVQDRQGRPVEGATVVVRQYPGGALATIYSDDGVTQIPGAALTTDEDGYFEYYAANGHYSWVITTNAGTVTRNDILHDDSLTSNQQFVVATGTGDAMVVAAFATGYTLADGDEIRVRAPGANTVVNPTITLPGVGLLTVYRRGGEQLGVRDIKGSGHELIVRYRAAPQRAELLNYDTTKERLTPSDHGAIGDGVIDDRAALQSAVDAVNAAGGGTVECLPGKTYLVKKKPAATKVFGGAFGGTWAYGLELPNNVLLDLRGSTIKAFAADGDYVLISNVSTTSAAPLNNNSNLGIVNGTIDGDSANRDGAEWSVAFWGVRKLKLDDLLLKNCDNAALFLEGCDRLNVGTIETENCYGVGVRLGFDGSIESSITDGGRIQSIVTRDTFDHPTNVNLPGNPILMTAKNLTVGSMQCFASDAGIKVFYAPGCQIGRAMMDGCPKTNSGFKVQSGAGFLAEKLSIGEIIVRNCLKGPGLYMNFADNVSIGSYLGENNGADGTNLTPDIRIAGTNIHIGRARSVNCGVGAFNMSTDSGASLVGKPSVTIDELSILNPNSAIAANFAMSVTEGYLHVGRLKIEDLRPSSKITRYFSVNANTEAGITIDEFEGRGCTGNPRFSITGAFDSKNSWVGRPDIDILTWPAGTLTFVNAARGATANVTTDAAGTTFLATDVGRTIRGVNGELGQITAYVDVDEVTLANLTAWTSPVAQNDWFIDRSNGGCGTVSPAVGTTSTVVTDPNFIGTASQGWPVIEVIPANAAARTLGACAFGTFGAGTVTFDHANAAGTEKYAYRIMGWTTPKST